ncbi:MAG: hypothetical protein ACYCW6_10905, partial [Candidatus Xenobia bacterium]
QPVRGPRRFRMDEGPPFVGADRPYMRGLGQDGTHNHGGVAEDMFQSHGFVGLLTPVLGDVLSHVQIDKNSVQREQVDTFNSSQILAQGFQPSDAATRVSAGFTVDTPQLKGIPFTMSANKGVKIETDAGKSGPPEAWFGTELHFKALPPALADHLRQLSGQPITPNTTGTLSIRVNADPKIVFTPDNGGREIPFVTPAQIGDVPPEATLLVDAGQGRTQNFSTPQLELEGWKHADEITSLFSNPSSPDYKPLGSYPLDADVRTLHDAEPRI